MKRDLEGRKLFRQIVDETPAELKMQLRFSDSIAEKIDGILKAVWQAPHSHHGNAFAGKKTTGKML